MMVRCASCGADNHSFASFCIACGEPFDQLASSAAPATTSALPETPGDSASGTPNNRTRSDFRDWATRETVLGVLVLLAAIGFAVYSWVEDTLQADAYRAGLAAERVRDWDRAAHEFRRAGDHPGALTALSNAGTQVYERNRLYSDAQEAARRDDWRTAARALERVQGIQPDFKNSVRMLEFARERAQSPDVSSIVFLQREGGGRDPGLYVTDAAGRPVLLPGSDQVSIVRARAPDGRRFVYDRPKRYDDYPVMGPGSGLLPTAFGDHTIRRIPVLVTLTADGGIETRPLPMLDGEGEGVFSPTDLWWTRASSGETVYLPVEPAGGSLEAFPVTLEGERLLALDPRHDRAVIAHEASGLSRILMRIPTLARVRMDQPVQGRVVAASVSPDGRWLLYIAEQGTPTHGRSVWVRSLSAGASTPGGHPLLLEQATATDVGEMPTLRAAFVPSADPIAEVIVERTVEGRSVMTVYRLDSGAVAHRWTGAAAAELGQSGAVFSNAGAYVAVRRQYTNASILEVTRLTRPSYVTSWYAHFPAPPGLRMLAAFTPADDFVVVGVDQKEGEPGTSLFTAQFGGRAGLGRLTYLGAAAPSRQQDFPTIATLPDPAAVLFVTPDHALRVAPASGKPPVQVASAVSAVWSLRQPAVTLWIGD
ncbi:MAG TPA: zinc ribbon domain-containing protein [Chloroflexia bacterium]|nr:zinc ribbon domain-containing protein [Chloroflexia bacterium]